MVWRRQHTSLKRWDLRKPLVKDTSLRRAKKYAKLQLWLWRKRQESSIFRTSKFRNGFLKKTFCLQPHLFLNTKRHKTKSKGFDSSEKIFIQSSIDTSNETEEKEPEMCRFHNSDEQLMSAVADASAVPNNLNGAVNDLSLLFHNVGSGAKGDCACPEAAEKLPVDVVLTTDNNTGDISLGIQCSSDKISKNMSKNIREYLCDFLQKYGSFIPLEKSDILGHLKEKCNQDFKDCEIKLRIIVKEMSIIINNNSYFEVKYKKHRLTLDDLSTLAYDSWLNDQVINMYGELIMESADSKVHFFNSFFHKQLMTKGYEGVKRWTKQVDLFSKRLLLVPVHVEVHWCLVTADLTKKTVCLFDSQGIGLETVARNIVKYLLKEAKEKKQTAFEMNWKMSLKKEIPQQTNDNDCGVFVLEYSRRAALHEPLKFSQNDIPTIRKRIYKELCNCTLDKKG